MNRLKRNQWGIAIALGLSLFAALANDLLVDGYSLPLMTAAILAMGLATIFQGSVLEERIKELKGC